MALISVADGEVKWVEHGQRAPAPPETRTEHGEPQTDIAPKVQNAGTIQGTAPQRRPPEAHERDVILMQPVWSEDGTKAVMEARAADNKDRWIFALDTATGKTRVIATDHDDAWVDGPGSRTLGWMGNDRDVYFQSERSGYSHLYVVPYDGGEPRALTSGKWEVAAVKLSRRQEAFLPHHERGRSGRSTPVFDAR